MTKDSHFNEQNLQRALILMLHDSEDGAVSLTFDKCSACGRSSTSALRSEVVVVF